MIAVNKETKLRCVIVDDDDFAIETLADYLSRFGNMEVVATFTDSVMALQGIQALSSLDFIFLDLEMPRLSGLELAKSVRQKTEFLLFATSHPSYALKAYELQVDQYLLKPFSFADFALKINGLLAKRMAREKEQKLIVGSKTSPLFIRGQRYTYLQINPDEIVYFKAALNYVVVYTLTEQHLLSTSIKNLELNLDSKQFIRISKSLIVAHWPIVKVVGNTIHLRGKVSLLIGDKYKEAFFDFLQENLLK